MKTCRPPRRSRASIITFLLAAVAPVGAQTTTPEPFVRTEAREPCDAYSATREPFFGELHIHTTYSSDAALNGTLAGPRDAYRFGKGDPIAIAPFDESGEPDRVAQLGRALDFVAVTDHAESFGADGDNLIRTCVRDGMVVDDSECDASVVWRLMQDAAEEHYDRSPDCEFTTFVAYEWTGRGRRPAPAPRSGSLHRNVIFRNADVPGLAQTADTATTPEQLWSSLTAECIDGMAACDVVTIPHSSNLSRGYMFDPLNLEGDPFTPETARTRAAFEPIVEMMQAKGDSECRPGVGTTDELCSFEKLNRTGSSFQPFDPDQEFQSRSFVRNALKEGLALEKRLGVNPFAFGFVAATDGHTSAPGSVREPDFTVAGNFGVVDSSPSILLSQEPPGGIEPNGGGLAVLWAEENSRDALFAAMRRREVYGTSGPRMVVRFFGGNYPQDLCERGGFLEEGYRAGVPMGGVLEPDSLRGSPRFAVQALRDPGTVDFPGAPLQRIQIVKGWLGRDGVANERVYDVAGDPDNGASVDPETCALRGDGFDSLCTVWTDPDFDPREYAFYYARVLENPTCRWHSFVCNDLGVRCDDPATVPEEFSNCCSPLFPRSLQERAWTSPIFYSPSGSSDSNCGTGRLAGSGAAAGRVIRHGCNRLPGGAVP